MTRNEEITVEAIENLQKSKEQFNEVKKEAGEMVITEEFLRLGGTSGIGWNDKQMEILGVEKNKGWMSKVIGETISDDDALRFLSYKGKKKKGEKEKEKEKAQQELITLMIKHLESKGYTITNTEGLSIMDPEKETKKLKK